MPAPPPPATARLHTPAGAGGIAVIVLAGQRTAEILVRIAPANMPARLRDNGDPLGLVELRDRQGRRIDQAVIGWLQGQPGGGPIAEINVHGGPRVTQRVLEVLAELGAEVLPADTAEQADVWPIGSAIEREMLALLSLASTELVLRALTTQCSAGLTHFAREAITQLQARQGQGSPQWADQFRQTAGRLEAMNRLLRPAEIVLAGPPNAGKSSLANRLLDRDACIVTDVAGTTRDWVRELTVLAGVPVWITDTAGLWSNADELDGQAVRRAWSRIESADIVLAVYDGSAAPPADQHWRQLLSQPRVQRIANKADKQPAIRTVSGATAVSAVTGEGVADLRRRIKELLGLADFDAQQPAAFTPRQAGLLERAADALDARRLDQCIELLGQLLDGPVSFSRRRSLLDALRGLS